MLTLLFSLRDCFRACAVLQAEILALRHQLLVLQRSNRGHKLRLRFADRVLWVWLSRLWNGWRYSAISGFHPSTAGRHEQRSNRRYALRHKPRAQAATRTRSANCPQETCEHGPPEQYSQCASQLNAPSENTSYGTTCRASAITPGLFHLGS